MLAYKFKLEREQKEADRKRTEAAGLRDFAQIAGKSVDLIRWRSLEVASEFAKSPSSKFVVLGGGQGALPMILNLGESSPPTQPAAAAEKPESDATLPQTTTVPDKGRPPKTAPGAKPEPAPGKRVDTKDADRTDSASKTEEKRSTQPATGPRAVQATSSP